MVAGEVDVEGGRLQHRDGQQLGQLHQCGHRSRVAAQVGRDDQRVAAPGQRGRDLARRLAGEGGRARGRVLRGVGGVGLERLLHHLARADQVDRAGRLAARDLQRAVHKLLDVAAGADLVVVLDVAAHDAALVGHILDPVNELVPPAGQLAGDGERRGAGEDQHGDAAAHRVADRAAEVLGARVDMHEDSLRLPGHGGVGVRRG